MNINMLRDKKPHQRLFGGAIIVNQAGLVLIYDKFLLGSRINPLLLSLTLYFPTSRLASPDVRENIAAASISQS